MQGLNALDEQTLKASPARYAYVLHVRENMKKFTMPTRSAQVAAITPSLIRAPSNPTRSTSPVAASTIPSKLRQPTKLASFPPTATARKNDNTSTPSGTKVATAVVAAATTTTTTTPTISLNVSPSIVISPTPTSLSPAPRRRAPMPRTWSRNTDSEAAGSAAAAAKALQDVLAVPSTDAPSLNTAPLEPAQETLPTQPAEPDTTQKVPQVKPTDPDLRGEDAVGPSPEPDINVWDIDDMCVVETPAAATPQPTLLEKMKDVTVNEELARLAEYATLEIVVITLPEAKKVCGILRGESYQKPAEGVRFDDTVTEMEHCMFEQEEFERDEEEERKRIERLSRYSSEEEEFERDVEVEDEGDDKEKDEGTDEDSGKESALDAWKRAMEEKTQKMREASSADHEDSKRPFRLQPRADRKSVV